MLRCLNKRPAERPVELVPECERIAMDLGIALMEQPHAAAKKPREPEPLPGILGMLPAPLQTQSGLAIAGAALVFVTGALIALALRLTGVL